jgi:hypothetical protein
VGWAERGWFQVDDLAVCLRGRKLELWEDLGLVPITYPNASQSTHGSSMLEVWLGRSSACCPYLPITLPLEAARRSGMQVSNELITSACHDPRRPPLVNVDIENSARHNHSIGERCCAVILNPAWPDRACC